jgi:hypothetical protein
MIGVQSHLLSPISYPIDGYRLYHGNNQISALANQEGTGRYLYTFSGPRPTTVHATPKVYYQLINTNTTTRSTQQALSFDGTNEPPRCVLFGIGSISQ